MVQLIIRANFIYKISFKIKSYQIELYYMSLLEFHFMCMPKIGCNTEKKCKGVSKVSYITENCIYGTLCQMGRGASI